MIDFRPIHNEVREVALIRAALAIVIQGGLFTLLALFDFHFLGALPTLCAALFTGVPAFVVLFIVAIVRPMVARAEGLEVEGELLPWTLTTEPKVGFKWGTTAASERAYAWMTVTGPGWKRDLVVIAHPSEIAAMKRLRSPQPVFATTYRG